MLPFFVKFWNWKYFFLISLSIPRPSRSRIYWPINSNKIDCSVYFQQQKMQNWREEMGHFSFWNCPNFVAIFCQVLKMEIIIFDIPSNPPPIAVRNSLTNQFFQNNWCFCIFSKKRKKKRTSLCRDIHPGDSWPYGSVSSGRELAMSYVIFL